MNKRDELEARLSQQASLLATWKSLLEHPGWPMLEEILEEQRMARLFILQEPLESFAQASKQEFMKGEAAGIGLSSKIPQTQIELLELETKRLRTAVELEESDESAKVEADVSRRSRVDNERDWHGGSGSG